MSTFPSHHSPEEVLSALNTIRNFLADAPSSVPPQIIVKGNGKKRAYGRASLKAMSYEEATSRFIEKFAIDDDWVTTPGPFGTRYPPNILVFATFCRIHASGADSGSVLLDETGWSELVENVEKMRLVFIPRNITVHVENKI